MAEKKNIYDIELSWHDFKKEVIEKSHPDKVYYRGHGQKQYKLTHTLARFLPHIESYDAQTYHEKAIAIAKANPQLKSFIEKIPSKFPFKANLMYPSDYENKRKAYATFLLMVHLRHHDIPSPLLDWTKEPYTAAFFAFSDVTQYDDAAILVLSHENIQQIITDTEPTAPRLFLIDYSQFIEEMFNDILPTDFLLKRHFSQDSAYTLCYSHTNNGSDISYEMMQSDSYILECLDTSQAKSNNYALRKYIIPARERKNALKDIYATAGKSFKKVYCEDFSYMDLALENFYFNY